MLSKPLKRSLVWGGVLILMGVLSLVDRSIELSPWAWSAALASAGLAAFGLYLADRSDRPMLLLAYVFWAIAGLIALVVPDLLRDEAVAFYVLLAIALPFIVVFVRNRAQRWALIPAYALLVVMGVITLGETLGVNDDLVSAYVMLACAIPFFVVYALDRRRWWPLIPGITLALMGLSFGSWLPWPSVRAALLAGSAIEYCVALGLLIIGVSVLVRAMTRSLARTDY